MRVDPKEIEVVSAGEEFGRRGTRKLVAISRVQITFANREDLDLCVKTLQESDERLAMAPHGPYDWQLVSVFKMTLSFGVAWYDLAFFQSKKEVFRDPNHSVIFSKFGKVPTDFSVQHFVSE